MLKRSTGMCVFFIYAGEYGISEAPLPPAVFLREDFGTVADFELIQTFPIFKLPRTTCNLISCRLNLVVPLEKGSKLCPEFTE